MEAPVQLSFPLPRSLDTRIYLHLTVKPKAIVVLLTTASVEEAASPTPLGSFVYALPDRYNPAQPLSTPLCTVEPTLEFATRLAKLLARRTQRPTYVGNSISFASTGLGGTVEEEMEAFKKVVEVALSQLQPVVESAQAPSDGVRASPE
ncbi:7fa8779b-b04c-43b6-8860-922151f96b57 [Thermothielavioides terrestris]|uniref:7fa8779b-b04c-43b6-8860-922151f96b57 n=1 Tax=Thermothielavioides terrestris TaxID=2587410 RepID=A0A3S4AMB8_9PEZI|nr:7fa8779b-b04c-43b6-8860-922151f96b57 [Thermothielavioides terrestris]